MPTIDRIRELSEAVNAQKRALTNLFAFLPKYRKAEVEALQVVNSDSSLTNDSKRRAVMNSLMAEFEAKKEKLELAVKVANATLSEWEIMSRLLGNK